MKITKTENLSNEQKQRIVELWNAEYPVQLWHPDTRSFDDYLSELRNPEYYLLVDENENIKGWLACFIRRDEKWFALLIDSREQKKGYGSQLLNSVKEFEAEINGWVIDRDTDLKANGETYRSPLGFYEKNDFEILLDVRLESETMSAVKIRWVRK